MSNSCETSIAVLKPPPSPPPSPAPPSVITVATNQHTVQNNAQAWFEAGERLLFAGSGNEADAVKFLKMAAHEHSAATAVLAFCYEFALGVDENYAMAEELYLQAGRNKNGLACARLAFLRRYGRPSVKIDWREADLWSKKARELTGCGAVSWLLRAACEFNLPAAHYALGVCYHDGVGIVKSAEKAVFHYRIATSLGQPKGE